MNWECGIKKGGSTREGEVLKAEFGMRPPASPSCRLYLRAGSRRGHNGLRPGGKVEKKKMRRWEKNKSGGWGDWEMEET